jgi:hypothetical protein
MAARDVLPPETYVEFRERLTKEFRERFLVPFGQCLDGARKVLDEGGDVATVLADCRAHDHLRQAATCSQSLLDMIYELSGYTLEGRVEKALQVNREKYRGVVEEACALST